MEYLAQNSQETPQQATLLKMDTPTAHSFNFIVVINAGSDVWFYKVFWTKALAGWFMSNEELDKMHWSAPWREMRTGLTKKWIDKRNESILEFRRKVVSRAAEHFEKWPDGFVVFATAKNIIYSEREMPVYEVETSLNFRQSVVAADLLVSPCSEMAMLSEVIKVYLLPTMDKILKENKD